ncbi:MAG: HIT domain-containing protein [Candidatus Omnitrophota bacterium]
MDKLWAPWRLKYVSSLAKKTKGCVFCRIQRSKDDKKNYVFLRTKHSFSVLNIYPYNNGHVLVMPNRHVNDLSKMTSAEKADLFQLMEKTQNVIACALSPRGFNIGINVGRAAGAGFPGHIHIHIVPRWMGDMNFMPITGNTKVISQSLDMLYQVLKKCAHAKK